MASNILFLPFRRSPAVSLSEAIKQYISVKYDQHPDMFNNDLGLIDQLRTEAIHVKEPHASGIRKIQAYAAQLVWIGGKFPVDMGIHFTWYPALGYHTSQPTSQNNLRFELSNILYNLASLYSQLATSLNRSTGEGLKSACNYFCQAAGVLAYLKSNVLEMRSSPAEDMDTTTLESLEQLMLAQAQECFWQKAVMDGFKDASIARLAAKVSDFYATGADFGAKSDTISSEWIHHMNAKHHHFAAAAQYRAACDCLDKRKYGEEVARLRDSVVCVNEGLKESRYINKVVLGDLNGLKNKVQEDLKRAEKDNDMIYLIPVPPKSELKTIDRANMAVVKVPKEVSEPLSTLGDHGEFGQPLFSKLVPYAVHIAETIYVERRDRLVNIQIIDELENMTSRVHDLLQSLNLPGSLQALERPLGIPPGLTSHAEEIRQQDGLNRLYRSVSDITKLRVSDVTIFNEALETLQGEAGEDDQARAKYGTMKWTRPRSKEAGAKLYKQYEEIDGYLKSAEASDELVKNKLKESDGMLRLLAGRDRDLEEFVPSSRRSTLSPKLEREVGKLRGALNEVGRLESRRRRKVQALQEKAKADDINSALLAETARLEREYPLQQISASNFESLFTQRLQRYDDDVSSLKSEASEQEAITARLQEANTAFSTARQGETSAATREREQALQKLENAYFKYKEIAGNLDGARKFYNDLAKMVGRFRDECKGFVWSRREEATQLENDISTPLAALSISNPPLQPRQYTGSAAMSPPLTAPIATRPAVSPPAANSTWAPNMGINFGAPPEGSGITQAVPAERRPWDPSAGVRFG